MMNQYFEHLSLFFHPQNIEQKETRSETSIACAVHSLNAINEINFIFDVST